MAVFYRWVVSITTMDGVLRPSVNNFYVSEADAEAWINAADETARAATDVGVLVSKFLAMTDAAFVQTQVGMIQLNDPVSNPADTVLRGNKLAFKGRSGGRGIDFSIPARKPASFSQSVDSLQVSITSPTAMSEFVTAYNAVVTDQFGNVASVQSASVVD
jgi:hypothetical protein